MTLKHLRGQISRRLDMRNAFGPWDRIFFSPRTGYFLAGAYGKLLSLGRDEGRLYMRGLASPITMDYD